MNRRPSIAIVLAFFLCLFVIGCAGPSIRLFSDASDPLQETTLSGTGDDRLLVIPIAGIITDRPKHRCMRTLPGMVQEVVAHLQLAEKDDRIKAVLLKIDTPGGTTTASDVLYHEIASFKERTGKKLVVCMMNVAASGGYYIALPADMIVAHPTSVTGSIGVILMRPDMSGLMEKIGVALQVNKSGEKKDMGSPFRPSTPAEEHMLQELADALGQRFLNLVQHHRDLDHTARMQVADARIFLAADALELGLVDKIGYLEDALDEARQLAHLNRDARVITYRRSKYPDDNLYNTLTSNAQTASLPPLLDLGNTGALLALDAGFYYLWPQALGMP